MSEKHIVGHLFKKVSTLRIQRFATCYKMNLVPVLAKNNHYDTKKHAHLKTCQTSYVTEKLWSKISLVFEP